MKRKQLQIKQTTWRQTSGE